MSAAPPPGADPVAMAMPYPAHREADVVLRDGSTIHVRPVRASDEAKLWRFFEQLSQESRALRFFSSGTDLAAQARREADVDYVSAFGLVATAGPDDRVVGHSTYVLLERGRAEVAFTVADEYQGRGLGTILLGHLAEVAAANGVQVFEAQTLPANVRMLEVFRESGFPIEVRSRPDEIHITFPTSLTSEAIERFERREQTAAVNALRAFLCPRSVAVIGASRQRGSVGGELFHNLLAYEFAGPVYPVNPAAPVVQSVPAYPTVEAIPGPVDLAIVVVPARYVVDVARQCGRAGVRSLVVISSGFGEVGEAGRALEAELLDVCRATGMRLVGPNCMGIVNTDPGVRLNGVFVPGLPPAGGIGFASQSGALGVAAIDYAGSLGLGISSFVSMGNKADISGNDLLNYWESDPRTKVILLYLESFGNPGKFSRIARRVGRQKPIAVVKSGRSAAGVRATSSHTGALLAASDVTVDALFRQAGVIRADTLEELFDIASLLANQPVPNGRRVGIVTNAGGPGILAVDTCEANGLAVPVLSEETRARLRAFLPPEASVVNPVDLIASATADHYRQAVKLVAEDPTVDAVIVVFIPPLVTRAEEVATSVVEAARELKGAKPLLGVFMSSRGVPAELRAPDVRVPSYAFPEAAAIALAHAVRYGEWRQTPPGTPPRFDDLRPDEAVALVARALGRGGGWLAPDEVAALFACFGLPLARQKTVRTPKEVRSVADSLDGAVAVKAIVPGLIHKTEAGAVRLALQGGRAAEAAAREMAARLAASGHAPEGFLVQEMVPGGVEMIVGVVHEPRFGPVVACGAGGTLVEVLKDVVVRLAPLTRDDATEMVRGLKSFPLLGPFRGQPARDVGALEEVLLRVSALAEHVPQLAELDCNPVVVLEKGAAIVDARVRVEPAEPPLPLGARRWPT